MSVCFGFFKSIYNIIGFCNTYTRQDGHSVFVDFHLIVPGEMTVLDSHTLCDQIEVAIKAEFPNARIQIHVEPEHKAKSDAIAIANV